MNVEEQKVATIINKYEMPFFQIYEDRLVRGINDLMYYEPSSTIDKIINITRQEGSFLFGKKHILRDELINYPNVKLVFELYLRCMDTHRDRCPYLKIDVKITTLTVWLKNNFNSSLYDIIKNDKRFFSKVNNNWMLIPFNLGTSFVLRNQLKTLT